MLIVPSATPPRSCSFQQFGLQHTLTAGIISGLAREIPSGINGKPIEDVIQTDVSSPSCPLVLSLVLCVKQVTEDETRESCIAFPHVLQYFFPTSNCPPGLDQPRQLGRPPPRHVRRADRTQHGHFLAIRGLRRGRVRHPRGYHQAIGGADLRGKILCVGSFWGGGLVIVSRC